MPENIVIYLNYTAVSFNKAEISLKVFTVRAKKLGGLKA